MTNHCKGCLTNEGSDDLNVITCNLQQFNRKGKCPCTKCLIKMICQQACPDYFTFKSDGEKQDRYDRRYNL